MSSKNLDNKGRFRGKIVSFRCSEEENALLDAAVKLSRLDEVSINYPDYYKASDKADEYKAKILELYPDLSQLMKEYANAQIKQTELGRFHEFSVDVRVGAQLIIEMLKGL